MGGALRGVACLMPAPVEWFLQAACCLTLKKEACTVFLAEPSCALPFTPCLPFRRAGRGRAFLRAYSAAAAALALLVSAECYFTAR